MPPWKGRRCRGLGGRRGFKPMGVPGKELEKVVIALDEFETLRLCDLEGKNQLEAAEIMGISRGTVQRLLGSARQKTAEALLHNKMILLSDSQGPQPEEDFEDE